MHPSSLQSHLLLGWAVLLMKVLHLQIFVRGKERGGEHTAVPRVMNVYLLLLSQMAGCSLQCCHAAAVQPAPLAKRDFVWNHLCKHSKFSYRLKNYPCKLDALQARRAFLDLLSRQGHCSISEDVGQAYLDFGKLLHDSPLLRVIVLNRVIAASGHL